MRSEMLHSILSDLNGSSADIEASAVLSTDGLMMASMLPAGMDEDRVGAMSAAMLSLGDRTAEELAKTAVTKKDFDDLTLKFALADQRNTLTNKIVMAAAAFILLAAMGAVFAFK